MNTSGELYDFQEKLAGISSRELAEALKELVPNSVILNVETRGGSILATGLCLGDNVFDIDGKHGIMSWFNTNGRGHDFVVSPVGDNNRWVFSDATRKERVLALAREMIALPDFFHLRWAPEVL